MTSIPATYLSWLAEVGTSSVRYDVGGIELHPANSLVQAQVGYAHGPDGENFTRDTEGEWRPAWLVIGYESAMGDPIILDTESSPLRVLTAPHGAGSWDPVPIADTLEGFAMALRALQKVSVGREGPLLVDQNPLPEAEQKAFLRVIAKANPRSDISFWEEIIAKP